MLRVIPPTPPNVAVVQFPLRMKKHKTTLCCLFLILCGGCGRSTDDPKGMNTDLKSEHTSQPSDLAELLQKVRSTLPQGWAARLTQKNDQLIVAFKKEASVEYRSEAAFILLKRVDEPIQISLVRVQFITVDEYENQKNNNQLERQKRIEFEEKHLSHLFDNVLQNHKISNHPFPPKMYNPQTADDKQAVTDYEALWNNTEPMELPTHMFKNASFRIKHYPIINAGGPHIYIVDEHLRKQHDAIMVSLSELLSEYE